jgi:hypothetical protein
MATTITAGNATNGAVIVGDNTGSLELKTGTGSGTTGLTINASQNATFAGTVASGAITATGSITATGAIQASGVTTNLYPLVSGTSQSATGSAVQFTDIPSWVKRITVMFYDLSTTSTNAPRVQLGTASSYETSGYAAGAAAVSATPVYSGGTNLDGFLLAGVVAAVTELSGILVLVNPSGNAWVATVGGNNPAGAAISGGGRKVLGGVLTRLQLIPSLGTFDAGTVNIMWE